jgi:outer membrane lipoprotein carrier protein
MIDFLGIITRTWLGMHAPATALIQTAPLVATPAAGSAATAATAATTTTVPTPNDVVDNVQKFYASIKQVTAQFRQSVTNKTFGTTKDSDGMVWLSKPGKMRWDYLDKKKQSVQVAKSFISNGTTLYVVEHANKQVVKKNLSQDLMPVAVTFLYGKGDLKAEFNAAIDTSGKYGSKADIVLKLSPKKPSAQYKNLYLVVNKTDFHVSQSVIIDSSDNTNQFRFFSPDFVKDIKDTWYEFNEASVKNYRFIDADQPQSQGSGGSAAQPVPAPMPPAMPAVPPAPAPKFVAPKIAPKE